VELLAVIEARQKMGLSLSQSRFAELLGISVRTLQDSKQGQRKLHSHAGAWDNKIAA